MFVNLLCVFYLVRLANSDIAVMKCFATMLFIFSYFIADILTANYIHPVDEEDYKILKDLAEGTFIKAKKERTREEKSTAIRFC